MDAIHFIVPTIGLLFLIQSSCIVCIHRRVKRLEAAPAQHTWVPEPTYYGVPIMQPPPSAPPQNWRDSVI